MFVQGVSVKENVTISRESKVHVLKIRVVRNLTHSPALWDFINICYLLIIFLFIPHVDAYF